MERRKEILSYNVEWLKFAETKATLLLTILGVVLTIIYTNANDVYSSITNSLTQIILSAITCFSIIMTLLFCFITINPRLKNVIGKSVIYYGTIKNFDTYIEYNNKLNSISDEDYKEMLSEQIYINSKIAWSKYINVGWAIRFFSIMILSILVQIIITLF